MKNNNVKSSKLLLSFSFASWTAVRFQYFNPKTVHLHCKSLVILVFISYWFTYIKLIHDCIFIFRSCWERLIWWSLHAAWVWNVLRSRACFLASESDGWEEKNYLQILNVGWIALKMSLCSAAFFSEASVRFGTVSCLNHWPKRTKKSV